MEPNDYNRFRERRLYKRPKEGKVCGVCAGIADYIGYEAWLIRLIFLSGLLFSGGFFVVLYIALCLVLETEPGQKKQKRGQKQSEYYRPEPAEVLRAGGDPKKSLTDLDDIFTTMEKRLEQIEKYVTSKRFSLDREFKKMDV